MVDGGVEVGDDEVRLVRQPANAEDYHHEHHHFNNLKHVAIIEVN